MPKYQPRNFEVTKAVREATPLIIGLAGETGTGKTVSALRLASGMAKYLNRKVGVIDTEARRALNYADKYNFYHVDFEPPFGPLDYISAIDSAIRAGCGVIVCDSMSHEHSGNGGVLDQIEKYLDAKCGDDENGRQRWNQAAHAKIKPQRRQLNDYILQLGRTGVILILCYRASDKTKPEKGQGIKHVGFVPETTSNLRYEMTQAFLLMPGAKGKPCVTPETNDEKIWNKTPMQFEGWVKGDAQLDEAMGEKFARWASGEKPWPLGNYVSPFETTRLETPKSSAAKQEPPPPQVGMDISEPCGNCKNNPPRCVDQTCNRVMLFRKAGISRQGQPYQAFWQCPAKCKDPKQRNRNSAWKADEWHAILDGDRKPAATTTDEDAERAAIQGA